MDPELIALRRQRALTWLIPLFVTSGATSLVYETLWERQLHLVVGTSQLGVITVLAAFMTGLAIGGFAAGRVADTLTRPLRTYALLEGGIGLYALIFPLLLGLIEPIYLGFWRAFEPSPLVFAAVQFVVLGLFLLPPTICMGATLPLLARFASESEEGAGRLVGRLYGANTFGAVLGVALAGFVLLPQLGLATTTWVTAAGNGLLCLAALGLAHSAGERPPLPSGPLAPSGSMWAGLPVIAALAGLSSLLCEVSWFRLMVLQLGGSAYAFSIMLLSFLLGLALGGGAGGWAADKAWAGGQEARALKVLAGLQVGVAVLVYGAMYAYGELPFAFVALYTAVERTPEWLWPAKLILAASVMLPPALLMGATFPFLVRIAARSAWLGGPVGRLYGWNTVGAVVGASVGGLLLLPNIRVTGTLLVAVSLNLGAAAIAWVGAHHAAGGRKGMGLALGWTAAWIWAVILLQMRPPPWDPMMMTAGMYKYVSDLEVEERDRAGILDFAVTPYELVFYEEGLSSVVTVARSKKTGNVWLANNGKVDASTNVDMPTQVLVAHLPFLFQDHPDDVLVIGLASGITAGSVTLHRAPSHIDLVELEPAVVRASHEFDEYNHRPLEDPRVKLWANDGRNHVLLMPEHSYDVVVSEPSNPWLTGVSNLFTREFFELGKSRLKPGGVWGQWVQMYGMDKGDLASLLATFSDTYAHVLLFSTIEDADLVLVGSDSPLDLDVDALSRRLAAEPLVQKDLDQIQVHRAEDVLARWFLDGPGVEKLVGDVVRTTDDNMRIEYSAPLHLHDDTADDNFFWMLDKSGARERVPFEAVHGAVGMLELARAYGDHKDWLRGLLTLKEAARLAPHEAPESAEIEALFAEYQGQLMEDVEEPGAKD